MIKVTGSPKIHERFGFGFTDDKYLEDLERKLNTLSSYGFTILDVDLIFGFITVVLPNPAITPDSYKTQREFFISKIEDILNNLGEI